MGTMTFLLPEDLSPETASQLERAWIVAGSDQVPWPTQAKLELPRLLVQRQVDESGCLVAPWDVARTGRVMSTSGTLIERPQPYDLLLELARGKLNQLRGQALQWQEDGLVLSPTARELIQSASRVFCQAVGAASPAEAHHAAQLTLNRCYQAAEVLVQNYVSYVRQLGGQLQTCLATGWGCGVRSVAGAEAASSLASTFDHVVLQFPWSSIEPSQDRFDWSQQDALLDWADGHGLGVVGGPLIDFSSARLPDWLWLWERDLASLAKCMCNYVTAALKRYRDRIRRWQLTSASNSVSVLSLSEHEILWLTVKAARLASQVDPGLELIIGVAQPWCDYLAHGERELSPFLFAETIIRELKLAALDLEVIMGVTPRGSYCRDLLETSRLLDSYADLGVPLRVTLGYPSSSGPDPKADPDLRVDAGHWHDGVHESAQAEWATAFAMLASFKPFVEAVNWVHWSDAELHLFPHCGLLDSAGKPKASLQALQQVRQAQLD